MYNGKMKMIQRFFRFLKEENAYINFLTVLKRLNETPIKFLLQHHPITYLVWISEFGKVCCSNVYWANLDTKWYEEVLFKEGYIKR